MCCAGVVCAVVGVVCCGPPLATPTRVAAPFPFQCPSDGMSCTRETVQPNGSLSFACTSSQQNLLVWKTRPKW